MAFIHVLYGFSSEKIEMSINKELLLRGYDAKSVLRSSKELIKDYLVEHKEVSAVVLKEYLDGGGKYSAKELSELADITKANIVVVLASNHRGKNEMKEIYSCGILNAYFSDGKFGANPDALASLIVNGRARKEARQYYRIDEVVPDKINLTYEEYRECFKYLVNKRMGLNIVDRFVTISRWLYPGQMGAFCDMLPDKVKDILKQYKEFYDIANKCYNLGYAKTKYKIPKGVTKGITKDAVSERQIEDVRRERGIVQSSAQRIEVSAEHNGYEQSEADSGPAVSSDVRHPDDNETATKKVEKPVKEKRVKKEKARGGLFGKKKAPISEPEKVEIEPKDIYEDDSDIDFSKVQDLGDIPVRDESDSSMLTNELLSEDVEVVSQEPVANEKEVTATAPIEDTEKGNEDYSNMSTEELLELFGK